MAAGSKAKVQTREENVTLPIGLDMKSEQRFENFPNPISFPEQMYLLELEPNGVEIEVHLKRTENIPSWLATVEGKKKGEKQLPIDGQVGEHKHQPDLIVSRFGPITDVVLLCFEVIGGENLLGDVHRGFLWQSGNRFEDRKCWIGLFIYSNNNNNKSINNNDYFIFILKEER